MVCIISFMIDNSDLLTFCARKFVRIHSPERIVIFTGYEVVNKAENNAIFRPESNSHIFTIWLRFLSSVFGREKWISIEIHEHFCFNYRVLLKELKNSSDFFELRALLPIVGIEQGLRNDYWKSKCRILSAVIWFTLSLINHNNYDKRSESRTLNLLSRGSGGSELVPWNPDHYFCFIPGSHFIGKLSPSPLTENTICLQGCEITTKQTSVQVLFPYGGKNPYSWLKIMRGRKSYSSVSW